MVAAAAVAALEASFTPPAGQLETLLLAWGSRFMPTAQAPASVAVVAIDQATLDRRGLQRRGVIVGVGYRGPNPSGKSVNPFAAQFCEVEVNTSTGEVRVLRFLGAHDSGRVMSRLSYDSQVYGGIVMGIGFGMTERRLSDFVEDMAATMLAMIPPVLIVIFMQKQFVRGMTETEK